MGIYRKKVYEKNEKGQYRLLSESFEKVSHTEKFWIKSQLQENKSNLHEHTYLTLQSSGEIGNRAVVSAVTYFPYGIKVERDLMTTSNKMPKKLMK